MGSPLTSIAAAWRLLGLLPLLRQAKERIVIGRPWAKSCEVSGKREALGQLYVDRAFPPQTKARADEMIENLRAAVQIRIQGLEWMGDETKAKAITKLEAFNSKIDKI